MKLRDVAKSLGLEVGCSDSGCIWGNQGGMCTNGGCRCLDPRDGRAASLEARRFARVAQHLAAEVERLKERKEVQHDLDSACFAELKAERDRMRPVVEEAQRWNRDRGDRWVALSDAVDAYEKAVGRG